MDDFFGKTSAERAAWEFIEKEGGNLELSVVATAESLIRFKIIK